MGALMRAHDWTGSPLGPPGDWPQSLRTVVSLMINSRHPMFVAWGPELALLYNDDYVPIFGAKHPHALGLPFRRVWSEIWDEIRPLVDRALSGEPTWSENMHLTMLRNGYPEDTWYTFSYSPVQDETGNIAGMFCACTETTDAVLSDRRISEEGERFRALVDASAQIVWATDSDGTIQEDSPSWQAFTGQSILDCGDAIHPDDRAAIAERWRAAVADRTPLDWEYRLRHVSGEWRWTRVRAMPLRGADGSVRGWVGMNTDITESHEAEKLRKTLIDELNHRVRNTLAIVKSIASQTRRHAHSVEEFGESLDRRLQALGTVHTLLADSKWSGSDLAVLIRQQIQPFCRHGESCTISGPDLKIMPKPALALTLIIHELVANAVKYGALSESDGRVEISWDVADDAGRNVLTLDWVELGGPPVEAPTHQGFGTQLIDFSIVHEFEGKVVRDYRPDGLVCRLTIRLPATPISRRAQSDSIDSGKVDRV